MYLEQNKQIKENEETLISKESYFVDKAIKLDKEIKEKTKELDELKSRLQTDGLLELENKNIKYLQFYGSNGSADVTYRQKCDVDNIKLLTDIFGKQVEDKITREVKINYKIEPKLKTALVALYLRDYNPNDVDSILAGLGLSCEQIKLAKKKLKGDYFKDKELLKTFGVSDEDLEEELDAIRESKNYELIDKYIDIHSFDDEMLKDLKRAISVEETLSIGLSYEAED